MPDAIASNVLWGTALLIAVAVLAVVILILTIIHRVATDIDDGAKRIWVIAKNDANATIHLGLLGRTNQLVADINEAATVILHDAGRIAQHAQSCQGCPKCVVASASTQRVELPPGLQGPAGEAPR